MLRAPQRPPKDPHDYSSVHTKSQQEVQAWLNGSLETPGPGLKSREGTDGARHEWFPGCYSGTASEVRNSEVGCVG